LLVASEKLLKNRGFHIDYLGHAHTPPEFIDPKKISAVEKGAAWLLRRVNTRLGPKSTAWAEAMIQARGVEGVRVLLGHLEFKSRSA
jgi:hypothetical protein